MTVEKCKAAALRYVAAAIKTEGQVMDYLKRKEFSADEIQEAVDMLREYSYVDDRKYCCDYYLQGCRKTIRNLGRLWKKPVQKRKEH